MISHLAITISRQSGSGGQKVGQLLAKRLGIACFNREMIERASRDSGISEVLLSSKAWEEDMAIDSFHGRTEEFRRVLARQQIFSAQAEAIRNLVSEQPCILVGRAADYVLEHHKNCLTVFLNAQLSDRVKRVSEKYQLSEKEAESAIRRVDRQRASYYHYFTEMKWGAAEQYDCTFSTSRFGLEGTAEAIERMLKILSLI